MHSSAEIVERERRAQRLAVTSGGPALLHCSNPPLRTHTRRDEVLKRRLDIVGAALALIALLPLLLMIALLIRLTSRGPALFRQERTGLHGKTFTILKFRTMRLGDDGDVRHASKDDPRVTWLGAFLRKSSLDELPQLLNVLRGDMSLVGPRPHARAHDIHYAQIIPNYERRFAVKPGITGYAQVRGLRGEIHTLDCMRRRIQADCHYAENWSVRGDTRILLQTAAKFLWDPAAY